MAYYSFTFENTSSDQTFQYDDLIDTSRNPHMVGPVNHGDTSPEQRCWVGGDGKGHIMLKGSEGPSQLLDVRENGESFRY